MEKELLNEQNEAMNIDIDLSESSTHYKSIHAVDNDCLVKIFSYFTYAQRVRLERVCKRWEAVSRESWRSVKSLNFSISKWGLTPTMNSQIINIIVVRAILMRCGEYLDRLDLTPIPFCLTTDGILSIVGEFCQNIRHINIGQSKLSPAGLLSLSMNCRHINSFIMSGVTTSCENDLAQLFSVNRKFQYLRIEYNDHVSGECLKYLPADTMRRVSFSLCSNLMSHNLNNALAKFNRLRDITFNYCDIDDTTLEIISKITTITNLSMNSTFQHVSRAAMIHLANLVNLQNLQLNGNGAVTDDFVVEISDKCKKLIELNLSDCDITTRAIFNLSKLKMLEELNIDGILSLTDSAITEFSTLKVLDMRGCKNISDFGIIKLIDQSPYLTILDIRCRDRGVRNILQGAIQSTKRRTNNVVLTIYIDHVHLQNMNISHDQMLTPFLRIRDDECHY